MSVLKNFGFFDIILPFILIYALIFGILAKTQILGDPFEKDNEARARFVRSIISLISLSIAFLVVGAYNVVLRIQEFIPYAILYILSVFMLLVSMSAFYLPTGGQVKENEFENYRKVILVLSIIIFSILTLVSLGIISVQSIQSGLESGLNNEIIGLIIIFGFIGFVIYWITREGKKEEKGAKGGSSGK
ncbi:MAG: hypothetical protein BXU00_03335 [Candidatus Nanoclepta minutus]|uniref:Uncharacterized protein n=1 Tax=Candidatus Nanoclepta minutus TaxID=1940235 RepID=A0A397WM15_9ARCH|nr:MAG: hypothetical protein BXU00_03335 [Candidatus Nanoclepta minutus]